jgi:hypothetical protein
MEIRDGSANVDTESTRLQEIFYDNLFDISYKTHSFKNYHLAMSSCHVRGCIHYSKNKYSLSSTNVGYMARFPERSEGLATFRARSCRSHEKPDTQSNSAKKWTINFIQVWVSDTIRMKKLNDLLLHEYTDLSKEQNVITQQTYN